MGGPATNYDVTPGGQRFSWSATAAQAFSQRARSSIRDQLSGRAESAGTRWSREPHASDSNRGVEQFLQRYGSPRGTLTFINRASRGHCGLDQMARPPMLPTL